MQDQNSVPHVTVTAIPGGVEAVTLQEGDTARSVIERSGFKAERGGNWTVRINGVQASLDTKVQDNDRIILTEQIKGN